MWVRELHPAGDKCGRAQRNVDIVESRRNGPQLSMHYDDDDDDDDSMVVLPDNNLGQVVHTYVPLV